MHLGVLFVYTNNEFILWMQNKSWECWALSMVTECLDFREGKLEVFRNRVLWKRACLASQLKLWKAKFASQHFNTFILFVVIFITTIHGWVLRYISQTASIYNSWVIRPEKPQSFQVHKNFYDKSQNFVINTVYLH